MKYNLGIDIDGVVCDLYPTAFPVLKEMYPDKVKQSVSNSTWEKEYGLTQDQVCDCFKEVGKRGLLRTARLYPGAKEVLYKLHRRYNIYFISWRNYINNAREDTLYWLDSNKIPYEKLVITNNKYKIATKENFCFFLDDNAQQCNRIAKTEVPTYLFRRPWNEGEKLDALVKVVTSWRDVEKILNF